MLNAPICETFYKLHTAVACYQLQCLDDVIGRAVCVFCVRSRVYVCVRSLYHVGMRFMRTPSFVYPFLSVIER